MPTKATKPPAPKIELKGSPFTLNFKDDQHVYDYYADNATRQHCEDCDVIYGKASPLNILKNLLEAETLQIPCEECGKVFAPGKLYVSPRKLNQFNEVTNWTQVFEASKPRKEK